ncbi:MAG: AMP-binding protein [Candidatus Aminicenantes bacterium]|nr:AMP-binding protein [Candidatus Aminicenantes bacterium]NIM77527.1 AMP-binding protein [Candidatus Aminicenantes bacterium]NIN16843.1 AMP-binding protein [Candidatus Aminicenantes bacterium]NIN40721.1 AMP-binding protein [Candidatus Aminicenantes bacterium]NIN83530.1 AMP-binding protein [Candidatus Aminicenantes bacterium]
MKELSRRDVEDILALTPMQEGMLFHYLENMDGDQYFEQLSLEISGEIHEGYFEQAWNWVKDTNEMLRAQFRWEEIKKPVQIILRDHPLQVKTYDFSNENDKPTEQLIKEMKHEDRKNKFDLHNVPFRVTLCKLKEDRYGDSKYLALFSHHHILVDGWSTGIILKEFLEAYYNLTNGNPLEKKGKNRFKEFVKWMQTQDKARQASYWQGYLKAFDTRTPLPIKEKHNSINNDIKRYRYRFPEAWTNRMRAFVKDQEITLASLLYTAWGIMLQKYTDSYDVVFGTTVAGRNAKIKDVENMVGLFINTVPMRVRREAHTTVSNLLEHVHHSLQVREEYESTSLTDVKKNSQLDGKESLFDTILVIENYPLDMVLNSTDQDKNKGNSFSIDSYSMFYKTNYDLTVEIETFNDVAVIFTYQEALFSDPAIKRLMEHFAVVLREILHSPSQNKTVREIDLLTPSQRQQLLEEFNGPAREYPADKTIHELFEEQVERTPDGVVLVGRGVASPADKGAVGKGEKAWETVQLTYWELNKRSNQLAHLLRKNSVTTETVVGMMMEPSVDMVVSLLAVLKAGGAYLPIDSGLPAERIRFMLEDAGAPVLLTHSQTIKNLPFTALRDFEKNHDVSITVTPPRGHIKGFNDLPMPDRSLINLENYKNKIGMASVTDCISIQTTRGCPFECLFCHKIWSKFHVHRSAENIFNEIQYYYKRGVRNFAFIDDCFNLNRENSSRLFRLITQNKLKVQLFFPNGLRGDIMTPDYIDLMVEAGTRGINLSLETASPRLQKLIKKNLDLDKFKQVVDYIAGQHPHVILEMATMHGFPTETEEEAMMTLDFIKDIKWLHFPYIHILKIFPNTEMEEFALAHGVKKSDIMASKNRAFHELPETLPFPKSFTRKYQANFMNEYFMCKERLKQVLPVQMKILDENALTQKYNAYLPVEIISIKDIIDFARLDDDGAFSKPSFTNDSAVPNIFDREHAAGETPPGARKILFLDLSQHFSTHSMLYNVTEQPLGLIYLLTHLKEKFGARIDGRIYKSGNDFDSFRELKELVFAYNPGLIAIRTLTFFREFFHETVFMLRQWGIEVPIITGGPYASSDYDTILKDKHVNLLAIGEGEETMEELIEKMLENDFKIPSKEILQNIKGIAFADWDEVAYKDKSCAVMLLDRLESEIKEENSQNPISEAAANNMAYVMYTSGSTGVPKGVMVEHRQVNNCIQWMQDKFKLNETATIVQRTDLTFDPSVWEIFWPLQIGAQIKVLTAQQRKDAEYLIRLMTDANAGGDNKALTMMYCPASLLTAITHLLNKKTEKPRLTLPWLIIGAEPITMDAVKNFYSYFEGKIVNTYGPTEGTVNNTYYDLEPGDKRSVVPIGKPIANNRIYILSRDMQPMPIGICGEICIAGDSVARGYINNRQKTGANFIANHFGAGKLYKSGDMARWLEDGNIEILGRRDDQVKIRGYRIEIGEVQTALLRHPSINDTVVIARDKNELQEAIRECKKCGIWSNYPGITVNNDNVCNVCENMDKYQTLITQYFKTPADLEKKIREGNKNKKGEYDCLLVYACERVATYALYKLLDMGFKVLTVTYDSGHYDRSSLDRIKRITTQIGVDHIFLRHKNSDQILKESLKSAHTMCKGCIHTSTSLAAEYAYKNNIKFVIGETLSRGQIIDNKLYKFMGKGIFDVEEIEKENLKIMKNVAAIDKNIFDAIDIDIMKDGTAYEVVEFIDFYRYFDITNEEMAAYLDEKDAYWKNLENRAAYSTDCKICMVGDYNHFKELGYHYTGSAKSWELRLGHATLENVKKDLTLAISRNEHADFLRNLGYQKEVSIDEVEKHLCAYFVSDRELLAAQLREYLLKHIPDYMLPSYFIPLDRIPLTSSGKVDRKSLPLPDRSRTQLGATYVAPKSGLEKTIAQTWQEVLKLDKVGSEDNFFDLGGNSLDIIQVSGKLKQALSRDIPVVTIFTFPTVGLLAQNLQEDKGKREVTLTGNRRYKEREKGKNRLQERARKRARRVA